MRENSQPRSPGRRARYWSIGVYGARSPFHLFPHPDAHNPVLTCASVTDVPAMLVADPFMVSRCGVWFMFFEVINGNSRKGEIALATSSDGISWGYDRIVLSEPFHLSYPYVFAHDGNYYMIPETRQAGSVRLYKATFFPHEWRYHSTLIDLDGTDPSIFCYQDRWWMFLCAPPAGHASLKLYNAYELAGPWVEHPNSPIVRSDPSIARPAGRAIVHDGSVIRYAQDCCPDYGLRVRAFEVSQLTPSAYRETESRFSPVLNRAASGWNRGGMHHVDLHPFHGSWIACVDGWYSSSRHGPRSRGVRR